MNPLEQICNRSLLLKQELDNFIDFYDGKDFLEVAALANKINHMVNVIGSPVSVIPMLKAIVKGKVNTWGRYEGYHKNKLYNNFAPQKLRGMHITFIDKKFTNVMKGHFRWNFTSYMFDRYTRDYIQAYFFDRTVTKPRRSQTGFRLRMTSVEPWQNSPNQFIVNVKTVKDNDYKFFYTVDNDMMISNLMGDVTPTEREYMLEVIENKFGSVRNKV